MKIVLWRTMYKEYFMVNIFEDIFIDNICGGKLIGNNSQG
jgi:hypothetical protein